MKKIRLNNGQHTLVDDEDYEFLVACGAWHQHTSTGYVIRTFNVAGKKLTESMHRIILQPKNGLHVDHKNGDKLDNRKSNIRLCTNQQNAQNMKPNRNNKVGYKGVYRHTSNGNYVAQIQIPMNEKRIHLGSFDTPLEAAYVYDQFASQLFGEFARLNTI